MNTNALEHDWETVEPGTRVVFSWLHISDRSQHKWPPRDDGLFELAFHRMGTQKGFRCPVFRAVNDPKQTCFQPAYHFAFADDPQHVEQLRREEAQRAAEHEQRTAGVEAERKRQKEARRIQREERSRKYEQQLRQKAAELGSIVPIAASCAAGSLPIRRALFPG